MTYQGSVPANTRALSSEVELTVYLKGEFLGLAVIAVLLQVADVEFFQWESTLHINKQEKKKLRHASSDQKQKKRS